ncbi:MAG TPA: Rmf/CrpP family protein [Nonomuraea sp.]|nr:Rmf/CrpP family protein [Nonomuraea sp.]
MTDNHDHDRHDVDQAVDQDAPGDGENVTRPSRGLETLGPKAVLEAQRQGQTAALAGEPVTSCPWARATTPADQAAREAWVRGYVAGRTELRGHASS